MNKSEKIACILVVGLLLSMLVPFLMGWVKYAPYTVNHNDENERNFAQSKREDQIKILQEAIERALEAHEKKKSQ